MKKTKKTTSITGNHNGYTLFEILCAIVVISIGIVFLFPSFFKSGDALAHLSRRFHAGILLNNIVIEAEQELHEKGSLKDWEPTRNPGLDPTFRYSFEAVPKDRFQQTYDLTVRVSWQGSNKNELSKTAFISAKT